MDQVKTEKNDQATDLKALFNEVNIQLDGERKNTDKDKELGQNKPTISQEQINVNVLNLPPRREVHGGKNLRTHFKISRPFIRLFIVVVLLVTIVSILLLYGDRLEFI